MKSMSFRGIIGAIHGAIVGAIHELPMQDNTLPVCIRNEEGQFVNCPYRVQRYLQEYIMNRISLYKRTERSLGFS